jgi:hypothetical protein
MLLVKVRWKNEVNRRVKVKPFDWLVIRMESTLGCVLKPPEHPVKVFLWRPGTLDCTPRLEVQAERCRLSCTNLILMYRCRKVFPESPNFRCGCAVQPEYESKPFSILDAHSVSRRDSVVETINHDDISRGSVCDKPPQL